MLEKEDTQLMGSSAVSYLLAYRCQPCHPIAEKMLSI